jgi:hypothetical protein
MCFTLFWDVTQRRLVVTDVSGQAIGPIFEDRDQEEFLLDCLTLEDGTDSLSQNVGDITTNLRCVTSQKSVDLVYTAAGA